ncbi:MAG: adenylate/guanylate cyclase domain-containing protein [Deltaproteobacteria bacterium]|nr:adenylate/guanylate cyclase domain-containing protein [Deltaproteobacteria bacterium]
MKKLFSLSVPKITCFFTVFVLFLMFINYVAPQKLPFLTYLELKLLDTKFQVRGEEKPDDRIVIVSIDDESIREIGRWPWKRSVLAKAIQKLRALGAHTISLDMLFSEKSEEAEDLSFASQIKQTSRVVLGYFFYFDKKLENQKELPSKINLLISSQEGQFPHVSKAQSVEMNISPIASATSHYGFFDFTSDYDGGIRKGFLVTEYGGALYPSLALKTASVYLQKNIGVKLSKEGIQSIFLDDVMLPVDEQARFLINYRGGRKTYTTLSFQDLLRDKISQKETKNKIVLIGVSAKAVQDLRNTPFSTEMAGVEVHAHIIDNILNQNFLKRSEASLALEVLFILFMAFILGFFLSKLRALWGALFTLTVLFLIYYCDQFILFQKGFVANTVFIYLHILVVFVNTILFKYFVEEKRARHIREAFEHYLAPQLVEELIRDPSQLKLKGERKVLTVLFADIRDFTKISEKLPAGLLTKMLNEYMSAMSDVIFEQGGLIDKYMGDAIMVIYGAPIVNAAHADQAAKTGLAMLERLKDLNEHWKAKRWKEIQIGIGVHTGEMLVGNMGSSKVFDYTVIGDSVNLASRIEQATKFYKIPFLISQDTKKQFQHQRLTRKVDTVQVRGRTQGVSIYEVIPSGLLEFELEKDFIYEYEKALQFYENKQFEQALIHFKNAEELKPEDHPTVIFVHRCENLLLSLPGPDWLPIHKVD